MKLDVSDSMFLISSLYDAPMEGGPEDSPIARRDPQSNSITVHAQDQFRPVRVELAESSGPPALPTDHDSLCEFSVTVDSGLLIEDFEGEKQRVLTKRRGDLRVRITVRRTPPATNRERPSETFLIECWPAPAAPPVDDHPRLAVPPVRTVDPVRTTRPGDVVGSAGLSREGANAATRIGELLTEPMPDQSGRCTVSVLVPRRRRITFNWAAPACGWIGNGGNITHELRPGIEVYPGFGDDSVGYLNGRINNGSCRRTVLEVESPRSVTHAWEWLVPPHGQTTASFDQQVPLLERPTVLTLSFSDEPSDDETPWTRVQLTHELLPSTWAPLMEQVWRAGLSRLPGWSLQW